MPKPTIDKNTFREQLKTKRNLLFNEYCEISSEYPPGD